MKTVVHLGIVNMDVEGIWCFGNESIGPVYWREVEELFNGTRGNSYIELRDFLDEKSIAPNWQYPTIEDTENFLKANVDQIVAYKLTGTYERKQ